jgi:hypothetical protein
MNESEFEVKTVEQAAFPIHVLADGLAVDGDGNLLLTRDGAMVAAFCAGNWLSVVPVKQENKQQGDGR